MNHSPVVNTSARPESSRAEKYRTKIWASVLGDPLGENGEERAVSTSCAALSSHSIRHAANHAHESRSYWTRNGIGWNRTVRKSGSTDRRRSPGEFGRWIEIACRRWGDRCHKIHCRVRL